MIRKWRNQKVIFQDKVRKPRIPKTIRHKHKENISYVMWAAISQLGNAQKMVQSIRNSTSILLQWFIPLKPTKAQLFIFHYQLVIFWRNSR